jgi:hypothetical protein
LAVSDSSGDEAARLVETLASPAALAERTIAPSPVRAVLALDGAPTPTSCSIAHDERAPVQCEGTLARPPIE